MFQNRFSRRTYRGVVLMLSLAFAFTLLWLLSGVIAPAQASLLSPTSDLPTTTPLLAPNTILTVTNANDDGLGSLRQAIADATNGDIITFDGNYSIYLSSTLEITKELTIDGGTYTVTVSGDSLNDGSRDVRVFFITSTAVVTFSHLNIVSGTTYMANDLFLSGGGLYISSGSQVIVQSSTFANNVASFIGGGGIYNAGALTVTNSIFTGNSALLTGGGVRNAGIAALQNCIITGNVSYGNGGGIYNSGSLTSTDSTFISNTADSNGGAIGGYGTFTLTGNLLVNNVAGSDGGGIFVDVDGQAMIHNSTLTGNISSYGGGIANYSIVTITKSTLVDNTASYNGGGLYNYDLLTVTNSTLSNNLAQGTDAAFDGGGAIDQWGSSTDLPSTLLENVTLANNNAPNVDERDGIWIERGSLLLHNVLLVDNGTNNCTIKAGATFTATTDSMANDATCVGATSVPSTSLILAPLASNGGSTWTHALLFGSPAIDAGNDGTCLPTDQRGITRPQGAHCDIGAYEYQFAPSTYTLTVTLAGNGSGAVTFNPSGPPYAAGTVVTLTAVPSPTSRFTGWNGDVITTTNPLVVMMDSDKAFTATFVTHRVYLPLVLK